MIARKVHEDKYANLNDMEKDLLLMIENARKFHNPGSQIYKYAKKLKRAIYNKKFEIDVRESSYEKKSQRIRWG